MTSNQSSEEQEALKKTASEAALQFIRDGDVVGLGTGSTVRYLLLALGERVKSGFRVQGVPTSKATAELARSLGIPLLPEEENWPIEVAIDGADQVDANFSLIKGGGGALLREKIVAAAARRFIVIVDAGKCLSCLGHPMPVPVEVNRFGWRSTAQRIKELGWEGKIRKRNGEVFLTDGNHYILDVEIERIEDPAKVETQLNLIPGVVENGLFVGRTHTLIVGTANGVEIRRAP